MNAEHLREKILAKAKGARITETIKQNEGSVIAMRTQIETRNFKVGEEERKAPETLAEAFLHCMNLID